MGRKRCANPRFSRWFDSNFTGEPGSSSSSPPSETPPSSTPNPTNPPNPSPSMEDYGLPPPSPPPNPSEILDLEEEEDEVDDAEYARRLHVALNKRPRGIPADAAIISIDDSSDDEPEGEAMEEDDVPAESDSAGDQAHAEPAEEDPAATTTSGISPVFGDNVGSPHDPSLVSPITSAKAGDTENTAASSSGAASEDADEEQT